MNIQVQPETDLTNPKYFDVFGFRIPMATDGRRIWSPKFKRYIIEKLSSGEMTAAQISRRCDVMKSMVYQWKNEIAKIGSDPLQADTSDKSFEAFGFQIPMTNDGRRQWSHEFKKYVVEKHTKGQLSSAKIAKICDVDRSMVYQWKRDVRGYWLKQRVVEPEDLQFAEEKVYDPAVSSELLTITLRKGDFGLEFPADYPPHSLAELLRAL